MVESDNATLIISVVALVVSVLAVGFSGWQAVTAHLARTTPVKARWTIEYPIKTDVIGQWILHNTGGSTATDVALTVRFPGLKVGTGEEANERRFEAEGAVVAGGKVRLRDTEKKIDPRMYFAPKEADPGKWVEASAGAANAKRMTEQFAVVEWRDARGRHRRERIPLW